MGKKYNKDKLRRCCSNQWLYIMMVHMKYGTVNQFEQHQGKLNKYNVWTEMKNSSVAPHFTLSKLARGLFHAVASGTGVYQPWWISTAFFLRASRALRFAPVFLCSVPALTALSIVEYASPINFSIGRISSDAASCFFFRTSRASKTWSNII